MAMKPTTAMPNMMTRAVLSFMAGSSHCMAGMGRGRLRGSGIRDGRFILRVGMGEGHAAAFRRPRSAAMKARICCSVSGHTRTGLPRFSVVPTRKRSTSRPLRAAKYPKRYSPMPVSAKNLSMSERSVLIGETFTRICVYVKPTRIRAFNASACHLLSHCYENRVA